MRIIIKSTFSLTSNADSVGKVKIGIAGRGNANFKLSARAEALDSSKRGSGCPHHRQVGFIKLSSTAAGSVLFVCWWLA